MGVRILRAIASSLGAWRSLERQEGIRHIHGLTFPLAIVAAIGAPHGLEMVAEEQTSDPVGTFDAVMVGVLDVRNMIDTAATFARWEMPLLAADRDGRWPLVWAGGSGLYNPLPYAQIADLIVLGDAEPSLPQLLDLWHSTPRDRFLAQAASVSGVYVPSVHDRHTDRLTRGVADDVSVTLRHDITVSANGLRRVEIARGCKFSCRFCTLGWHGPLRENSGRDVIAEIRRSPKTVHLQAGDAESHTDISAIRAALVERGGVDTGWTGRLDTTAEDGAAIPGNKRYAFGVEGLSWRLRQAVGKAYLTEDRLVSDTVRVFDQIDDGTRGRTAWHMIAGLPGEQPGDVIEFARMLGRLDQAMAGRTGRNLAIHWQPFQPAPGTPMQWMPAGGGARRIISQLTPTTRAFRWLRVSHAAGRTDRMAGLCAVLARSDERGADLIAAVGADPGLVVEAAEAITGGTAGWMDGPLPWDFVDVPHLRDGALERSRDAYTAATGAETR